MDRELLHPFPGPKGSYGILTLYWAVRGIPFVAELLHNNIILNMLIPLFTALPIQTIGGALWKIQDWLKLAFMPQQQPIVKLL